MECLIKHENVKIKEEKKKKRKIEKTLTKNTSEGVGVYLFTLICDNIVGK